MKIMQINTVVNSGSTGHIAEEIGILLKKENNDSFIIYGRRKRNSISTAIKIENTLGMLFHIFLTRIFDKHGLASKNATRRLVKILKKEKPDLIHLHNIHGYFLNYEILFKYLTYINIPVVWTLHDCWTYTGHCAYYSYNKCFKWVDGCEKCSFKNTYPASLVFSNSKNNYKRKKEVFCDVQNLTIVVPSKWLKGEIEKSFLNKYNCIVINNGVDTEVFKRNTQKKELDKFIILGVANIWEKRKGFDDFIRLAKILPDNFEIVLIGLTEKQIKLLPHNVKGIQRTENQKELTDYYNDALVFFNPTYEDNFPTTNIEALSCGTPVITYNTGGSPEILCEGTGYVVEQGDIEKVLEYIRLIGEKGKIYYSDKCVETVKSNYDKNICFVKYLDLYHALVKEKE